MYGSLTIGQGNFRRRAIMARRHRAVKLVRCYPQVRRSKRNFFLRSLILAAILGLEGLGLFFIMGFEFGVQGVEEIQNQSGFQSEIPEPEMTIREDIVSGGDSYIEEIEEGPKAPKIVIDPGHGGTDEGCSREAILEKEINLSIAVMLKERLMEMGFEVAMTREQDSSVTLEERVQMAEGAKADIFISIHQNACLESKEPQGIETWYCQDSSGNSKRLASLVHQQTLGVADAKDRELRESAELYVLRETSTPACLIETGFISNKAERELLLTLEYQEKLAEGIAQGIELYFYPKTMYLTFDDGPSKENTVAILDILKERSMKATFFVVGENVLKYPEIAKRIVEEGHTIGIHCNSHEYREIYADVDSYVADFEEARRIVYEVTGVEAWLFRFPGGSINAYNKKVYEDIIKEMEDRGFVYFDWNAELEDAVKKPEPEKLLKHAKESTRGRKKVVMLAHDTVSATAACLEQLLDQFPEYKMEPLTPEVDPVQF